MVNKMNNRSVEVKAELTMANRAYYWLQNHMKSRIISRNTKTLLYKTLIRPVLIYGADTWVLSKQDEHHLSIFECKILRDFVAQWWTGEDGKLELTKNSTNCVVEMTCEILQAE